MAIETSGFRLYQTYIPSGSSNPQIQNLEQRIEEMLKRLNAEANRWFGQPDVNILNLLKNELDFTIEERNKLYQRLTRFEELISRADMQISQLNETIEKTKIYGETRLHNERVGGGIGFGLGGLGAIWYGLGAVGTFISSGVGALAGVLIGGLLTENPEASTKTKK